MAEQHEKQHGRPLVAKHQPRSPQLMAELLAKLTPPPPQVDCSMVRLPYLFYTKSGTDIRRAKPCPVLSSAMTYEVRYSLDHVRCRDTCHAVGCPVLTYPLLRQPEEEVEYTHGSASYAPTQSLRSVRY
eukprot:3913096-Rhodomonas_salina.1